MKQKFSWLIGAILFGLIGLFSFSPNASAAITLTEDKKEQYYQEYLKIAEELRVEYPEAFNFEVTNFEDFKDTDWAEPEQYRETIIPIINGEIEVIDVDIASTFAAGPTPTKHAQVKNSNGKVIGNVVINATVSTVYNASAKGQIISSINGVRSYTMDGLSHWGQTGSSTVKNSNNQWNLRVNGKYSQGGVSISDILIVRYSCNSKGAIS